MKQKIKKKLILNIFFRCDLDKFKLISVRQKHQESTKFDFYFKVKSEISTTWNKISKSLTKLQNPSHRTEYYKTFSNILHFPQNFSTEIAGKWL